MKLLGQHRMIAFETGRGLNDREHPMARTDRVKRERAAAHLAGIFALQPRQWSPRAIAAVPGRFVVRLTRFSPSAKPLDDDNLVGSQKSIRDGVADRLGVDDGNVQRIRFEYAQARGPWAVLIEIHLEDLAGNSRESAAADVCGAPTPRHP